MWSIALLCWLAAGHPHHGFPHPGGKKGETSATESSTDGGNGQCTGQTACNPDGSPCAKGEFCNFDEVPSCEKCSQFHAPAACTTMVSGLPSEGAADCHACCFGGGKKVDAAETPEIECHPTQTRAECADNLPYAYWDWGVNWFCEDWVGNEDQANCELCGDCCIWQDGKCTYNNNEGKGPSKSCPALDTPPPPPTSSPTTTFQAGCPGPCTLKSKDDACHDFGPVDTPFELMTPDAAREECGLSRDTAKNLANVGYDQVMCPFGVLVIGHNEVPANNVKFAANVIAELLDPNQDGVADVPAVQRALQVGSKTAAVFVIGTNKEEHDDFYSDALSDATGFPNMFGSQTERIPFVPGKKITLFHELHHLVHQQGWAAVWPEIFGNIAYSVDDDDDDDCDDDVHDKIDLIFCNGNDDVPQGDWDSSLICREVARLQCTNPGWVHNENTCPCDDDYNRAPGDPAPSPLHGTCNEDDCDCVEFHRAAGLTYAGQYDPDTCYAYDSIDKGNMPRTKATISKMLSDEYKAILDDPKYAQPRKPLTGIYKPSSTPASFAVAGGGAVSSWTLSLVAAAAFGIFSFKLYSKADGSAEAGPLLAKAS